jgi:hypothetical protein
LIDIDDLSEADRRRKDRWSKRPPFLIEMSWRGYPVCKVTLACIDRRFVYSGGGEYDGLLRRIDVTAEVARRKASVAGVIDELRTVVGRDEPQIAAGSQCVSPYACPAG